jgi:hypothetical protein
MKRTTPRGRPCSSAASLRHARLRHDGDRPAFIFAVQDFCKRHGCSTSSVSSRLNLGSQYWTSRGIAVFDVHGGGSTRARISARLLEPWHGGSRPSRHDVARGVHTNVHDSERIKTLYGSLLTGEKMTMLTGGACQLTGFPDLLRTGLSRAVARPYDPRRLPQFTSGPAATSLQLDDGFAGNLASNWRQPAGDTRRSIPPAH